MLSAQGPPERPVEPARPRKLWRAGTIVYTTGGLAVLFCWLLLGDFAYYLKDRSVHPTITLLLKHFEASDVIIGLLMGFLPQALALVLTPIVSYRSDRHRGRWGRRIPFLLIPTPFVFLSLLGLAYGPALGQKLHQATGGSLGENHAVILALGVSWALFEICATICNGIFQALFNDVVPREIIGRFWALFRVVNLLDGIVFNYFIIGHAETHYTIILIGVGIFYVIAFTAMCLRVKEGGYPPPPVAEHATAPLTGIRNYFSECFTQPYYLWYFASWALASWAVQPLLLFVLFFAKSLHMDLATYGKYAALQMTASLVAAYPIGWLVDRFHATRVTIGALLLYAVVTLLAFLLVRDARGFGIALVIAGMCAGIAGTSYQPLRLVLLPKAKFAQYASAMGIVTAIGLMLIGPVCGWFFDHFGHDYRYVYLFASIGTFLSLAALLVVYRKFLGYGGLQHYVAPSIEPAAMS